MVAVYDQGSSFVALMTPTGVDRIVDSSETEGGITAVIGDDGAAPGPQTQAAGLFAFLNCREHPDRVPVLVEQARALVADHDLGPDYMTPGEWAMGCLALYNGRYEEAREAFRYSNGLLVDAGPPSGQHVMSGLSWAAAELMVDRPAVAIEILDTRVIRQDPETGALRKITDTVADNAANAGIALGGQPVAVGDIDMRWIGAIVSRISSVGALTAAVSTPVWAFMMARFDLLMLTTVLAALVWWRHRENLARLKAGTEPKIGQKKD